MITHIQIHITFFSCEIKIRGDTKKGMSFGLMAKVDSTNDIWEDRGLTARMKHDIWEQWKGWHWEKLRLFWGWYLGKLWQFKWYLVTLRLSLSMISGHKAKGWHWTGCWGWHQPLNQPWTPELCLFAWKYFNQTSSFLFLNYWLKVNLIRGPWW